MEKFKVGDVVRIKSYEKMRSEYGGDDYDITKPPYFSSEMKALCGKTARIEHIFKSGDYNYTKVDLSFDDVPTRRYCYATWMIELVERPENRKEKNEMDYKFDVKSAKENAIKLLDAYGHEPTEDGVATIYDRWYDAKTTLRELFRRHTNWDEEQQAIIFREHYEAGINKNDIEEFCSWFLAKLTKILENEEKYTFVFDDNKYDEVCGSVERCNNILRNDAYCVGIGQYAVMEIMNHMEDMLEEKRAMDDMASLRWRRNCLLPDGKVKYLSRTVKAIREYIYNALMLAKDSSLVTQEIKENIDLVQSISGVKISAVVGQKVSRVIGKIGKAFGINNIVDIQLVSRGETQVEKDMGWNYWFAKLGDALNPVNITKYTVVSINPMDYWTMSFGTNWASCQTIDSENIRHIDGNHNYHGQYMAGTESYMLDETSVVFYTVDENWKGKMCDAPKDRRIMFHLDPSKGAFICGRLYPDGRDGGEQGLAAQFRYTFQKVVSECMDENNLWKFVKGTCEDYTVSRGEHYKDYEHYSDCGVCVYKNRLTENGSLPSMFIRIGAFAICPTCGETHCNASSLTCDECNHYGMIQCERCGDWINRDGDDTVYCEDNECYYCNDRCARNDNVHYCYDDEMYHTEDNCFYDDYADKWFFDNSQMVTIGECHYRNEDNAFEDGWRWCHDDDDWHQRDNCNEDDYDHLWFFDDSQMVTTQDGHVYRNEENAMLAGYVKDQDTDEWVKAA